MLTYLLDTDVVSKRHGANGANIRRWLATVDDHTLALSTVTLFEIARGIERKRDSGDGIVADRLRSALEILKAGFAERILAVDAPVADLWGAIAGSAHKQWMDRALIATARVYGLTLVSCNVRDMTGYGVTVINPDRDPPACWSPDGTRL